MIFRFHALFRHWLLASCAFGAFGSLEAQNANPAASEPISAAISGEVTRASDEPVAMERVEVQSRADEKTYDGTGMGSYEHQLRDLPFSNDLISADAIEDDPAAMEI